MTIRRVVYVGLGAMVVFTGGYLVVYLARWEWQRALMAGEFLLVSLVVLVAVAGAHRLARLERRIGELAEVAAGRGEVRPEGVRLAAVRPYGAADVPSEAPRFRWLQPEDGSYRVFIPVLLGAGILVSGLAALVERVAAAFGSGSARRPGRVAAPLALPTGGVLAGAPHPAPPRADPKARFKVAAWVTAGLLVASLALVKLADLTQDRPDPPVQAAASTLVIEAGTRGETGAATVEPLATRLWEYCRGSTRPYLQGGAVAPLGGSRYALVVQPALGEHALRRLRGCLQDTVIDHGRFRVVSVRSAG